MKAKSILMAFCLTTLVTTPVLAEVKKGAFTVTLAEGGYTFDPQQDMKTNFSHGAKLGYNLTGNWGLEGNFSYVELDPSDSDMKGKGEQYSTSGNILYHFLPERNVVPFLTLGGGWTRTTKFFNDPYNDDATLNYGAGLKYFLNETVALRADFRNILSYHTNNNNVDYWSNYEYTAGLSFQIGGTKTIPPAATAEKPAGTAVVAAKTTSPVTTETAAPQPGNDASKSLPREQAKTAVTTAKAETKTAQPLAPVTAKPVATTEPSSVLIPQPLPTTPAAHEAQDCKPITVRNVMTLKNGLEIITDSPIDSFSTFMLSKPTRLAIDIFSCPDRTGSSKSLQYAVNKMGISTVRVGNHPGKLRITVDSRQARFPACHIEKSSRGLKVIFKKKKS